MSCCPAPLSRGRVAGSGSSSPAGAPGWSLASEIDFRLYTTTAPIADGAITIGGFNFTAANGAAGATWRSLAGSGLQYSANNSITAWADAGGSQSATNLAIELGDFIADYDPTRRYLFQLLITANNGNQASERICFGVQRPIGVPTEATGVAMAWTFSGSTATAVLGGFGSSNSGGTGSADYTFALGFDVLSLATSPVQATSAQGYLAQSVAGDWPPQTAQRPVTGNQLNGTPMAITAAEFVDPRCLLHIAFPTGNNSATFVAQVAKMRALVAA